MGSCQQARYRVYLWSVSFTWSVTVTEKILKRHSISGRAFHGLSLAGCPGVFLFWGRDRLRFIRLQPRSSRQPRASLGLLPAAPQPREQECLARINHSTVLRTRKSQHLWGSGYVVLLLLTGLPPFIIADALVLLLGVTPAFGTVSPTSCKDGSRYMATSNGLGRKWAAGLVFFTLFPFMTCPSLFNPKNQALPDSCCLYSIDE